MNATAAHARPDIALRGAGLRDVVAIWRLQKMIFGRDAYDALTIGLMLLDPRQIHLQALCEGEAVGFIDCERNFFESTMWIVMVGTHPRFWGRGIASALIGEAERRAAGQATRLKLTVRRGNERAIALYTHLGFEHATVSVRYYNDGEDGLIMEKPLPRPTIEV